MRERILITVKTYPQPSAGYKETVCVAGVNEQGEWRRLYPIPFRYLAGNKQFKKYDIIDASIAKTKKDSRPESYHVDLDSVSIVKSIGTKDGWQARRKWIEKSTSRSLCELQQSNREEGISLGMVPVRNAVLRVTPDSGEWTAAQQAILKQPDLFGGPNKPLEKVPYRFSYLFSCPDASCKGHDCVYLDWEVFQSCREWRRGKSKEKLEMALRQTYEYKLCNDPTRETWFFMGTHSQHPRSFMVLGVFYPPLLATGGHLQPSLGY